MTGSDDHSSTRPISVAELLAKNGTIGAPPVGGRRRRRRGNADAVTVAELTGEIPIIRPDEPVKPPEAAEPEPETPAEADATEVPSSNGAVDHVDAEPVAEVPAEPDEAAAPEAEVEAEVETKAEAEVETKAEAETEAEAETGDTADVVEAEEQTSVAEDTEVAGDTEVDDDTEVADDAEVAEDTEVDDDYADAVADYAAHLEKREAEPEPVEFRPRRRFGFGRSRERAAVDAEQMSPDPVDDGGETTDLLESLADPDELPDGDGQSVAVEESGDQLPSYLSASPDPLFGGDTVADDLALRPGSSPADSDLNSDLDVDSDLDSVTGEKDLDEDEFGEPRRMSTFVHGLWIIGQSIVAVVFGAGLFIAFDQLWKWNNIVALVLSVLVILGLVVGVRVVRKTEDIGSTLIAVAVGALVTLGPLALLQSG
ncbi:hypothetical protein JDV09_23395 [Mycobacterium sp. Y57]|uniref:hypothetical protein n=1 Tax=Mycolicibacterium xanthum TaxID=2796469 RepID=UPI001C85780E|nr:hypothetical protein [Mycolicibacterium xanthum]MBX7435018.1 hypothetical protein [Mycolicibacterium xanthum]